MRITTLSNRATAVAAQLAFFTGHATEEDPRYLSQQLITLIGNKRALLGYIGDQVARVKKRLGKSQLTILDAFSGSGVVSRFFKAHADRLISNDIEAFAAAVGRCYLRNRSTVEMPALAEFVSHLNAVVDDAGFEPGFFEELYAPRDESNITPQDRVFYTRRNARRLDNYRRLLGSAPQDWQDLLLGPLLSEASVHANTAGVFKGFYKDAQTGVGRFGGSNGDALKRIRGDIVLQTPILSRFECDVEVYQEDANSLACKLGSLDLAYLDPPYNQHPYGSNYFMLNLLVSYNRPTRISKVSGIPVDWQRSDYNSRLRCFSRLRELVYSLDAKFILVSFNDEGFVRPDDMAQLLREVGTVESAQIPYNAFRGSRNLHNRSVHVTEYLFLVERR